MNNQQVHIKIFLFVFSLVYLLTIVFCSYEDDYESDLYYGPDYDSNNDNENDLDINKKILEGRYGRIEGFPHAVAIQEIYYILYFLKVRYYVCSGSIIGKYWVISTRNCFKNDSTEIRVIAGNNYIGKHWDSSENIHRMSKLLLPTQDQETDFALLLLYDPIYFSDTKKAIEIIPRDVASDSIIEEMNKKGKSLNGTLAAFGPDPNSMDLKLKGAVVRLAKKTDCMWLNLVKNKSIFLCGKTIGGIYGAPCYGDLGGGLIFFRNYTGEVKQYLVGVISSISKCDESTYTYLYPFKDSLAELMRNNSPQE